VLEIMGDLLVTEWFQDAADLFIEGLHSPEQWRLAVEHVARLGDKRGRNAMGRSIGILQDIGRTGHIPRSVTTRFEWATLAMEPVR